MEEFKDFINQYGLYANIDKLYTEMVLCVFETIKNYLPEKERSSLALFHPTLTRNECILQMETMVYTIKKEDEVCFIIPYMDNGSFVIEGVEKCITSVDTVVPPIFGAHKTKGKFFKGAKLVSEIRDIRYGKFFSVVVALTDEDKCFVNMNNFYPDIKTFKLVNPITFLKILLPQKTQEELVSMIDSFCVENPRAKHHLDQYSIQHDLEEKDIIVRSIKDFLATYSLTPEQFGYTVSILVSNVLYSFLVKDKSISLNESFELTHKRFDCVAFTIGRKILHSLKSIPKDKSFCKKIHKLSLNILLDIKKGIIDTYFKQNVPTFVQSLSKKSEIDRISHIRRIQVPFDVGSKSSDVRKIKVTQYGFICPFETPESKEVGLTQYYALTALLSGDNYAYEKDFKKIADQTEKSETNHYALIINNFFYCTISKETLKKLRDFRDSDDKYKFCSISILKMLVLIYTDPGRITRLVRDRETSLVRHIDIFEQISEDIQLISYRGREVEESGKEKKLVYEEIHGIYYYGFSASINPLSNHSQATRISYQSSISKQAIACRPEILSELTDSNYYSWYGQKPLSQTFTEPFLSPFPTGTNVVVSIMAFGDNQEDSLILNEASIQRGLFKTTKVRIVKHNYEKGTELTVHGAFDKDMYDHEGVILPGTEVNSETILFSVFKKHRYPDPHDVTHFYSNEIDRVGRVFRVFHKRDEYTCVILHYQNSVNKGDKLESRYSQKGVIGSIKKPWELPYSECGIIPDIILNPHAIPSRMTVGHLIETVIGALVCKDPSLKFNTNPFDFDIQELKSMCEEMKITLFDPETFQLIHNNIFTGICYYQPLKHMVCDKYQGRSHGPISVISRQPVEGRSKSGGLRLGEMEKDALVAYEAKKILKEKFMMLSDPHVTYTCTVCHSMWNMRPVENKISICYQCGTEDALESHIIPYSFKLIFQTLQMAGINVKFDYSQ